VLIWFIIPMCAREVFFFSPSPIREVEIANQTQPFIIFIKPYSYFEKDEYISCANVLKKGSLKRLVFERELICGKFVRLYLKNKNWLNILPKNETKAMKVEMKYNFRVSFATTGRLKNICLHAEATEQQFMND
jgi:hypothetical protein